ncbi:hypothetical protein [Haloferax sp. ATB1]|uniref:hypothetical protein n=1 Tax=Haloferax sp. ATB1 TaxID=1508454 RepID=UPI0005B232A9|nr:hypothetical protein [Haloferax sp. ATB1]
MTLDTILKQLEHTLAPVRQVMKLPLTIVAAAVGFAPLAVLFSFVLRLSWVAQQNTSVAPFSTGDEAPPF